MMSETDVQDALNPLKIPSRSFPFYEISGSIIAKI